MNYYTYSQVINYAKGWFKKTDTIEDLKKILSYRSGIKKESINLGTILDALSTIYFNYHLKNNLYLFQEMLSELFIRWKKENICTLDEVIQNFINKISIIKIKNDDGSKIINLEKPNYEILEKSNIENLDEKIEKLFK